jgi:hypothetical protein
MLTSVDQSLTTRKIVGALTKVVLESQKIVAQILGPDTPHFYFRAYEFNARAETDRCARVDFTKILHEGPTSIRVLIDTDADLETYDVEVFEIDNPTWGKLIPYLNEMVKGHKAFYLDSCKSLEGDTLQIRVRLN